MSLLLSAFNPRPKATPPATDDFWYTSDPVGYLLDRSGSDLGLGAEAILNCGTVLAAVRFRGDSWAMCPPATYRKTERGRMEDPGHYSQIVLRNPNLWQTGNRWRHLNGVWMATWGNAYNEIRSGRTSFVEELWPMHPSRVKVAEQRADGSLVYEYKRPGTEVTERLGQDRVLHFRDFSTDGISGVEMYRLIRNVVGIALLAERHATTFLKKGARVAGMLVPNSSLRPEQRKELRESVNKDFGGVNNTGMLGVLPYGVDLKVLALTNRESQFIELGDQIVGSILRFLGVPGVVVGYADKTATYASAKEFFESGGIKHCVLPLITNVEAEEEKALLLRGDTRQIKHNLDVLLRANTKDRFESLFRAIGGPWMSVNEGRRIEDLNEDPDPRHDEILTPANMAPELQREASGEDPEREETEDDEEQNGRRPMRPAPAEEPDAEARALGDRARQFAVDAAARIVRREVAAIKGSNGGLGAALRFARDPSGWRAWAEGYYQKHAVFVAATLHVDEDAARAYCDRQRDALLSGGLATASEWEPRDDDVGPIVRELAAVALEGR